MSDYNLEQPHALPHVPTETVYICPTESELPAPAGSVTPEVLGGALVRCGLIDPEAIDDPEGYDNHLTKDRVAQAARELSSPNEKADLPRSKSVNRDSGTDSADRG